MGTNATEKMMLLLQELVLLKKLDATDRGSAVQSVESQERQKRRNEIGGANQGSRRACAMPK